jgi:signal transduction histidine kinase
VVEWGDPNRRLDCPYVNEVRMRFPFSTELARYSLAALAVGIAVLATHLLSGIADAGLTPLFFAAVLLSAWYGGLGPGLFCTLLSAVAAAMLLIHFPAIRRHGVEDHILRVLVFTTVAVLTSSLHGAMQRAAEASRRAKEAAESASAAKSRFLAMVSHELRTPLSPVLMAAEMLEQDPALPPAMLKDIQTIRRNVDLEIRLIEDLVDLTRISVGKLHLRQQLLDPHEPLKAAAEVCRGDISAKEIAFTMELAAGEYRVEGDPVRLQQIFWNLLRNAIKFTPRGGRIHVTSSISADQRLTIDVTDTGIGIDPAQLSKIFEAFEQGGPDLQAQFGGLGLGLAICQGIVEAHHGSIRAASPGKGKGATFTLLLPLAPISGNNVGEGQIFIRPAM